MSVFGASGGSAKVSKEARAKKKRIAPFFDRADLSAFRLRAHPASPVHNEPGKKNWETPWSERRHSSLRTQRYTSECTHLFDWYVGFGILAPIAILEVDVDPLGPPIPAAKRISTQKAPAVRQFGLSLVIKKINIEAHEAHGEAISLLTINHLLGGAG